MCWFFVLWHEYLFAHSTVPGNSGFGMQGGYRAARRPRFGSAVYHVPGAQSVQSRWRWLNFEGWRSSL